MVSRQRAHVQKVGDRRRPAGPPTRQRAVVIDIGGEVAAEMADGIEGNGPGGGVGLSGGDPDHQGTGQPGPMVTATTSGRSIPAPTSAPHGRTEGLEVGPGHLGNHPAEPGVLSTLEATLSASR